jgi:hypothetical protein
MIEGSDNKTDGMATASTLAAMSGEWQGAYG